MTVTTFVSVVIVVLAVLGVAAFVRWAARVASETSAVSERMKTAAGWLNDFFEGEAAHNELMALYSAGGDAEPLERVQHLGDSAADWVNLLFARYAGAGAALVYDGTRATWVASVPLFDGGPLIGFSVDVAEEKRPMDALLAAVELVVDDAPPVMDSSEQPTEVCVRFAQQTGHWEVYQPCEECGGGWLSTNFADTRFASVARWTAREYLVFSGSRDSDDLLVCARCLAREMREGERICHQPTCWYDTLTGQWMLSDSLGDDAGAVSVPLGIETFFVDHGVILRAANHQLGY